jgi:hypothetical protein
MTTVNELLRKQQKLCPPLGTFGILYMLLNSFVKFYRLCSPRAQIRQDLRSLVQRVLAKRHVVRRAVAASAVVEKEKTSVVAKRSSEDNQPWSRHRNNVNFRQGDRLLKQLIYS